VADFRFNGIDQQYVFDGPTLPLGAQPRTLSAWFRTSETGGAHVIANWGTPQLGQRFGLLVDAGRVKLVGEFQDIMTTSTFADGQWHHAAATFDGSYAVVYVDGRPQVSGQLKLDTRGDILVIGNAMPPHSPEWWNGEIDQVTVFPRALEGTEIAGLAGL
jgi:sialidase-1